MCKSQQSHPEEPYVGMTATINYPQDKEPAVITDILNNGDTLVLAPLDTHDLQPVRTCNGFPVFDSTLDQEEELTRVSSVRYRVHKNKMGIFVTQSGCWVILGVARYYRNFAD